MPIRSASVAEHLRRAAVESWIRPNSPIDLPQPLRDIMGCDAELCDKAAAPTYPCLVCAAHRCTALQYDQRPDGGLDRRARPYCTAGRAGWRERRLPQDGSHDLLDAGGTGRKGRATRMSYVDADWVKNGSASRICIITGSSARSH
jgi:hypothetical protein